jgi:hypothetical protein
MPSAEDSAEMRRSRPAPANGRTYTVQAGLAALLLLLAVYWVAMYAYARQDFGAATCAYMAFERVKLILTTSILVRAACVYATVEILWCFYIKKVFPVGYDRASKCSEEFYDLNDLRERE